MKLDYDDISPITGNKCVIKELINENEGLYASLCMQSGYNTVTNYHKDNKEMEEIEKQFPDLIRDYRIEDENGFYWYLTSMNLGVVMLYPDVDEEDGYIWCVMPVMLTPDIIDGKMNFELDIDNAEYYSRDLFETAFDKFQEIAVLKLKEV